MSKNTNSTKSIKSESPKTPGGISISLLTPCRRVGLSRSWRKKGPSPFISPLSNSQRNADEETSTPLEKNSRKRKKSPEKDSKENEDAACAFNSTDTENTQTPTRADVVRKRSKNLLSKVTHESKCEDPIEDKECELKKYENIQELNVVTKKSKLSKSNSKNKLLQSNSPEKQCVNKESNLKNVTSTSTPVVHEQAQSNFNKTKNVSPQNLTTECVVVIQKKIFKNDHNPKVENKSDKNPKPSQVLFDSDSEDIPLFQIHKNKKDLSDKTVAQKTKDISDNTNSTKVNKDSSRPKVGKLEHKKTSTTDLKAMTKISKLSRKNSKPDTIKKESKPASQSSFDDEDDDDFDFRKTIIVKKSYDKVAKPLKAKSTGSITDKDIEELRSRIEVKKKLLLAKSLDSDSRDLRDLIKKWQRGCQDALLELMELMKKKMPDQPNMENGKILEMLKIPAELVGYDSENDCFNSPNDTNIILSSLKI